MRQQVFYHASPPAARRQIQRYGLRPGGTPIVSTLVEHGPGAVYLFRLREFAENYRMGQPADVWAVNARSLRVHPDPEDPQVAVYYEGAIEPRRLKLLGTFMDGEEVTAG